MSVSMIPIPRMRGKTPRPRSRGPSQLTSTDSSNYTYGSGPTFSDDDFEHLSPALSPSREKMSYAEDVDPKKAQNAPFATHQQTPPPFNPPTNLDEGDDVEAELDMFNKAIHISNIDEIDHVGLMRGMHERFQRKQLKWQQYASSYSKWAFGINFVILVMQIVLMLFHQLVEVFRSDSSTQDSEPTASYSFSGYYRRYNMPDLAKTLPFVFNPASLQAVRCVLAAFTAALAGLQMKLKLTEKAEKYRRGAKVYARLHRLSTYYLMLAENGGKVEDVTGLWRDALKKEGKWIPVVKTYMAT